MRPAVLARAVSLYALLPGETPTDAVTTTYAVNRPLTTFTTTEAVPPSTRPLPIPTNKLTTASRNASAPTAIPSSNSTSKPLGQKICNENVCISGTRQNGNDTCELKFTLKLTPDVIETVKPTPRDKFGWIALGFGTTMHDSPMVILWPGAGGIVLSQRQAAGHAAPAVADAPRKATVLDGAYSNATGTSMRFSVPASSRQQEDVIWAFSKTPPRSADPGATLAQHIWAGTGRIEFGVAFDGRVPNSRAVHARTADTRGMPSSALLAHVAVGVMATMFLLPGGAVVPRLLRGLTTSRVWFPLHIAAQGGLSLLFLLISLGTGGSFKGPPSAHRGLGIALFVFFLVQCILGITLPTKYTFRGSNFLHIGIGVLVVVLGWATCWTGFVDEWPARGHGYSAPGLRAGWGVLLGFWVLACALAWYFLPRRQRDAQPEAEEQKSAAASPAAVTPYPPEPQPFSPPPSPSLIPLSGAWGKRASPRVPRRPSAELRRSRLSDLHSGMPGASGAPRVPSRDDMDEPCVTYEGSLSRRASEESVASRFSRGSLGSLCSRQELEESLATGLYSLKNSVTSLKSLRSSRDAPPTSFPFRRGSDSALYHPHVAVDPFKSPVTPTFKPIVAAPSAFRKERDEDALSFRARGRRSDPSARARRSEQSAGSGSETPFSYRERQASEASYTAIDTKVFGDDPPLRLADRRDSDPFGLNKALGVLGGFGGFGDARLSFSADSLALFRGGEPYVVNAITGVRERRRSRRRGSDQTDCSRRSGSGSVDARTHVPRSRAGSAASRRSADAAPSSFARSHSVTDLRRSAEGRRSSDAAPSSFPSRSRSNSAVVVIPAHTRSWSNSKAPAHTRSRSNSRTAPPVAHARRGSVTPPAILPRARPHVRAPPRPPPAPTPAPPRPPAPAPTPAPPAPKPPPPAAAPAPRAQLKIHPLKRLAIQPASDLRVRRLSNNAQLVPSLRVQTGRRPPVSPAGSGTSRASSGSGSASVPITKTSAPLASPVVPCASAQVHSPSVKSSVAATPGHSSHTGQARHPAPFAKTPTTADSGANASPIASRFAKFRASIVSAHTDESLPPPVPPKD